MNSHELRVLDARLAREVMGWAEPLRMRGVWVDTQGDYVMSIHNWHPTTSDAQALMVAKKMRERGYRVNLDLPPNRDSCCALFIPISSGAGDTLPSEREVAAAFAGALAMAIGLAVAEALDAEKGEKEVNHTDQELQDALSLLDIHRDTSGASKWSDLDQAVNVLSDAITGLFALRTRCEQAEKERDEIKAILGGGEGESPVDLARAIVKERDILAARLEESDRQLSAEKAWNIQAERELDLHDAMAKKQLAEADSEDFIGELEVALKDAKTKLQRAEAGAAAMRLVLMRAEHDLSAICADEDVIDEINAALADPTGKATAERTQRMETALKQIRDYGEYEGAANYQSIGMRKIAREALKEAPDDPE